MVQFESQKPPEEITRKRRRWDVKEKMGMEIKEESDGKPDGEDRSKECNARA